MILKTESSVRSRIDWMMVATLVVLIAMGTLAVLSAASPLPYYGSLVSRHFLAVLMGALLFAAATGFNYQIYQDQAKSIYSIALFLLVLVVIVGATHKGHRSWLPLGPLTFQPSELARIILVLALAAFLDSRSRQMEQVSTVILAFALALPFMGLILKQPDYSTTLTFLPVIIAMLFCAGASLFHLSTIVGFGATVVAMPLLSTIVSIYWPRALPGSFASFLLRASQFGPQTGILIALMALMSFGVFWLATTAHLRPRPVHFVVFSVVFSLGLLAGIGVNYKMKGYQRGRFAAYVAPQADIQGAAYHVRQSQIAIGSGGLFGKGLFSGTQSQLGFLPERHTDFIYAVIGEEMGFFGALLILGLYLFLIWRIVRTGELARDRYGYLVCAGLATMFGFELVLNAGMCLGILPVAGVPLPMISYGGSSLMISLWSLGIVSNIYARRYALL